ncbi:transposase family protein [Streptomyces kaempferi]
MPSRIADLRPYFDSVPDPRARRGRWYSLTAILLVCACAVVSGARSIDELSEWGQRASDALLTVIGIRRHLLRWRHAPSLATIGRVLGAVDGDALDRAVGAYLADRHRTTTGPRPGAVGFRVEAAAGDRCRRQSTQGISPSVRDAPSICSPRSPTTRS